MPLELIMNANGQLGHASGSTVTGGTFTITSTPSVKVKAGGSGVYRGPLTFTFAGGSAPGLVAGSVTGAGTINPTATKTKADGLLVIREGDSVLVTFTGTNSSPPPPTLNVAGTVEVASAGQTKAKAQ